MEKSNIEIVLIKKSKERSRQDLSIKNITIDYHIGKRKFKEKLDYLKRKKENLEDNIENITKRIEYCMEINSIIKEQINNIYNSENIKHNDNISFDTNKLNNYKQRIINNTDIIKKLTSSYEKIKKILIDTNETIYINSKDNNIKDYFTSIDINNISEELEKYENDTNGIVKNSKIFI